MIKTSSLILWFLFYGTHSAQSKPSDGYSEAEYKAGREAALARHNMYRSWHGMPPMKLNDELSKRAQEWAVLRVQKKEKGHSTSDWRKAKDGTHVGENLYGYWSGQKNARQNISQQMVHAVDAWYYEYCDEERYPKKDAKGVWHLYHDTQVLWRGSTELGMGFATRSVDGTDVEVAGHYKPAGNFMREEDRNLNDATCHKQDEICEAFNNEKPLEGPCDGGLWVPPTTSKPEPAGTMQEMEESDEVTELDESGEGKHTEKLKLGYGNNKMDGMGGMQLFKMLMGGVPAGFSGVIKVIKIGGGKGLGGGLTGLLGGGGGLLGGGGPMKKG